jgi:hypothetical protein
MGTLLTGRCPKSTKAFWINLRLAAGDYKTRLRLKQLSSLICRFAKLYEPKRFEWLLQWISFGQRPVKD